MSRSVLSVGSPVSSNANNSGNGCGGALPSLMQLQRTEAPNPIVTFSLRLAQTTALGCSQRFSRRVVLFEISSTPRTELNPDTTFTGIWRLLARDPELQQREEFALSAPYENGLKSVLVRCDGSVRFKFVTTPNSIHALNLIAKDALRSWFFRKTGNLAAWNVNRDLQPKPRRKVCLLYSRPLFPSIREWGCRLPSALQGLLCSPHRRGQHKKAQLVRPIASR